MRRLFLAGVLIVVLSFTVAMGYQGPPAGAAQGGGQGRGAAPAPQPMNTIKVRDNLYMIANNGGNTAVFIMANGVALVDTKNPNNGQGIMDEVRKVTNKPVKMIINTHTHADHTGSNEFFTDNIEFVAHENTKVNMAKMTNFAGEKAKFMPGWSYSDLMTIGSGADQIVLYYFGKAHTNGDSFVVFPALRAMHSGDAFASKSFPLIDVPNGGSAVDYGGTLARAAASIKNVDTIINGHITTGPTPFSDLQVYSDFNTDFINWVQDEIKAGKTADQAAAEYQMPQKYVAAGYTAGRGGPANNVRTAYTELGK